MGPPSLRLQDVPEDGPPSGRAAAVAVLLFPRPQGTLGTVLTVRPLHLPRHAGQVSFPGGAREPEDLDLVATACRETREEIGVELGRDAWLGWLPGVFVRVSGFYLAPAVFWARCQPELHPDAREVAAVLLPSLPGLFATEREETVLRYHGPTYRYGSHLIWGATARILADLRRALQPSPA